MKHTLPDRVRLGVFDVDLRTGELREGDRCVILQDQSLRILCMLVDCDGGLVSREEIRNNLWPNDTVVEFDHSINAAIKKLRQALGDSPDDPKYIETIRGKGYRLLVPVERVAATEIRTAHVAVGAAPANDGAAMAMQLRPAMLEGWNGLALSSAAHHRRWGHGCGLPRRGPQASGSLLRRRKRRAVQSS